jgi:DNA-binding transcriptional ArsR family regulator
MQFRKSTLPEYEIHTILANPRRREALRELGSRPGTITVRELADVIAESESGSSPAPSNVRDSVYISLHQTHLPKLHELGIVDYDRENRSVELLTPGHVVGQYMDVLTPAGFTWGEYYRAVGVVGLLLTTASLADLPVFSGVDPLLWASGFLGAFAVSTAYQLWTNRWNVLRSFLS